MEVVDQAIVGVLDGGTEVSLEDGMDTREIDGRDDDGDGEVIDEVITDEELAVELELLESACCLGRKMDMCVPGRNAQ